MVVKVVSYTTEDTVLASFSKAPSVILDKVIFLVEVTDFFNFL